MHVPNVVGVCLKHFISTGNKNVRERAKPSNILAEKKVFFTEKRVEINIEDSAQKKNKNVHKKLFCFTDSNVYNYYVLLVFAYK